MYLIDTNVISEMRKREKADRGVQSFFRQASERDEPLYLSVVTVGELRRGIDLIHYRGDRPQADLLERWLSNLLERHGDHILAFGTDAAQVWGRLRVPHPEHEIDKQIAAIALVHELTVVTRNDAHFRPTGVGVLNPFAGRQAG